MDITRLQHLITVLQHVPPAQLDMSSWFYQTDKGQPACGTAACAAGHACLALEFQRQGLAIHEGMPAILRPLNTPIVAWGALMKFFDLSTTQVVFLFSESSYPHPGSSRPGERVVKPADVIDHITVLLS